MSKIRCLLTFRVTLAASCWKTTWCMSHPFGQRNHSKNPQKHRLLDESPNRYAPPKGFFGLFGHLVGVPSWRLCFRWGERSTLVSLCSRLAVAKGTVQRAYIQRSKRGSKQWSFNAITQVASSYARHNFFLVLCSLGEPKHRNLHSCRGSMSYTEVRWIRKWKRTKKQWFVSKRNLHAQNLAPFLQRLSSQFTNLNLQVAFFSPPIFQGTQTVVHMAKWVNTDTRGLGMTVRPPIFALFLLKA